MSGTCEEKQRADGKQKPTTPSANEANEHLPTHAQTLPRRMLDSLWDLGRQSGAGELLALLPETTADAVAITPAASGATHEDCEDDSDGTAGKARCP